MLTNPFYTGAFRLKEELYPGSHPAMISKETFDKIQRRLKAKNRKVNWSEKSKDEPPKLKFLIQSCKLNQVAKPVNDSWKFN